MRSLTTRIVTLALALGLLAGFGLPASPAMAQEMSGELSVTITEGYVAYLIETQLPPELLEGQAIPIENPQLGFAPDGKLEITVATEIEPFGAVEPTITIGIVVANNTIDIAIETISLSGLVVPAQLLTQAGVDVAAIEGQIETAANEALAGLAADFGVELAGIDTTDTTMTVRMASAP